MKIPTKSRLPPELNVLNLSQLAAILGRGAETIKKDLRRRPNAVPPRLLVPGTRLLRWREIDVAKWLARHVAGGDV